MASWILFSRRTCPGCPPVRDRLKDIDLPGTVIDVDEDEGFAEARDREISATPTVLFLDAHGRETARALGLEDLDNLPLPVRT